MKILPVVNVQMNNRSNKSVNFEAKKSPEIINKELAAKLKSIEEFYSNPKNAELIKQRNEFSEKVAQYIEENIHVKPEVLKQSFGPIGGKWPHEAF